MIIVSQDKTRITEKLELSVIGNEIYFEGGVLGIYATEERAKEVLNEIIEHYNSLKRKSVYAMGDSGFTFEEKFYYEMPKE